jgi:hypothetical protein
MKTSGINKRPKLSPVSDEMKRLSMLLGEEVRRWPEVTARPMFGMRAFYRRDKVFAMLPDKRALDSPTSIAYKLESAARKKEGEKWRLFELADERELSQALACLDEAYKSLGRMSRKGTPLIKARGPQNR